MTIDDIGIDLFRPVREVLDMVRDRVRVLLGAAEWHVDRANTLGPHGRLHELDLAERCLVLIRDGGFADVEFVLTAVRAAIEHWRRRVAKLDELNGIAL